MRATLLLGSCESLLRELPDCSIDSIVTDPPAGIGFMSKEWDSDKGGRAQWIAWLAGVMREALRVLRPGGYALVWALPRTSHWTATAVEDAGFEIRDVHHHIFGSGFPKSLNVAKNGADRWEGYGTALKPAVEHWILARRPLEGTYAENVLKHGTGALNIERCRIGGTVETWPSTRKERSGQFDLDRTDGATVETGDAPAGRWPAHLSLEHAAGCKETGRVVEERPLRESDPIPASEGAGHTLRDGFGGSRAAGTARVQHVAYECVEGCPVRVLDEQSGERKSGGRPGTSYETGAKATDGWGNIGKGGSGRCVADVGGASRFFYVAKPSRREKDTGLDDLPASTGGEATGRVDGTAGLKSPRAGSGRTGGGKNSHPTVKAVTLMRWLVRLITPPGGLALDMFAGSGTTGIACAEEGMRFLGIEQDGKSHEIARLRLRKAFGSVATELPAQAPMAAMLIAQPRSAP